MKKISVFFSMLLFATMTFAADITTENYQRYIGKHIRFNSNIETTASYKIGRKTFNRKKYSGVVLTISNIEQDKKGNVVISLTQKLEEGKIKEIKLKTKASKVELHNIIVIEDIKPKPKPKPAQGIFYSICKYNCYSSNNTTKQ